jgi:hypothetical protein
MSDPPGAVSSGIPIRVLRLVHACHFDLAARVFVGLLCASCRLCLADTLLPLLPVQVEECPLYATSRLCPVPRFSRSFRLSVKVSGLLSRSGAKSYALLCASCHPCLVDILLSRLLVQPECWPDLCHFPSLPRTSTCPVFSSIRDGTRSRVADES